MLGKRCERTAVSWSSDRQSGMTVVTASHLRTEGEDEQLSTVKFTAFYSCLAVQSSKQQRQLGSWPCQLSNHLDLDSFSKTPQIDEQQQVSASFSA